MQAERAGSKPVRIGLTAGDPWLETGPTTYACFKDSKIVAKATLYMAALYDTTP